MDWEREWQSIGLVLDLFNKLDLSVSEVIVAFVRPDPGRKAFVTDYMMHTSVLPFYAKLKLILAIVRESRGPKVSVKHLNRAMKYRNALAHFHTAAGLKVNRNALRPEPYGSYLAVETLDGQDLRLESKARAEVIADALESIEVLEAELTHLRQHLEQLDRPPSAA